MTGGRVLRALWRRRRRKRLAPKDSPRPVRVPARPRPLRTRPGGGGGGAPLNTRRPHHRRCRRHRRQPCAGTLSDERRRTPRR